MATTWPAPLLYCAKVAEVGRVKNARAGRANNDNRTERALTRGPWTRSGCPAPREPTSLRPACPGRPGRCAGKAGERLAASPACWPAGGLSTSARPQRPPADSTQRLCPLPGTSASPAPQKAEALLEPSCWGPHQPLPPRPGRAFQARAAGRRACWASYCWGPTLAGGPRAACPRTESWSFLFLKGALPLTDWC